MYYKKKFYIINKKKKNRYAAGLKGNRLNFSMIESINKKMKTSIDATENTNNFSEGYFEITCIT